MSRRALQIVNAAAGANGSKAALSFDDNEVTNWSNDGQLSSAWINYRLAHPAAINEVTIKLASWRTTSYPLRLTVDGKVVFEGNTAPSLGYLTITFPRVTGRQLKVEMIAPPRTVDSLGNIVGVLGNKDVDDPAKIEEHVNGGGNRNLRIGREGQAPVMRRSIGSGGES